MIMAPSLLFLRRPMTTSDPLLLQSPSPYDQPKLKSLPLREQPAYRVSQNAAACNLSELLAAVIGGPKQIEIAEALTNPLRRRHTPPVSGTSRRAGSCKGHQPGDRSAHQGRPQPRAANEPPRRRTPHH